jgi:hypothetical protein
MTALRRPLLLAIAALLTLGAAAGAAAQEFHLTGMAGERLADADMAKGVTIVIVWASWSPRSHDLVERVKPLAVRWGSQAHMLTVDFEEDRKAIQLFLVGKQLPLPVFLDSDGAFSKKYAVATLPGLLIIKDGTVAYRGKLTDDADRIIADALH